MLNCEWMMNNKWVSDGQFISCSKTLQTASVLCYARDSFAPHDFFLLPHITAAADMEVQWNPLWWWVMYFCQGGRDDLIQKALDKAGLLAFAWNPLKKCWAVLVLFAYDWSGYAAMHLQLFDRGNTIWHDAWYCLMMSGSFNRRFETRNMVSTERIRTKAQKFKNDVVPKRPSDGAVLGDESKLGQFSVKHWISRYWLIIMDATWRSQKGKCQPPCVFSWLFCHWIIFA